MEFFHSIILGIVQGLTEFLPISSSAHLILIPWLFHWQDLGQTFDMALHLGTLFAIVIYFWRDWIDILKKWREPLLWLILLACLPAAFVGFKYEEYFETVFRSPLIIASFMLLFALVLAWAEIYGQKKREFASINIFDALIIGFSQALALMPGVSRSGITMVAGLFLGLNRTSAARFSFLLSTPIIAGAGIFKLRHIIVHGLPNSEASVFMIGTLASAVVGVLAIKFLMQYLQKHTFYIFVWYRIVIGCAASVVWFLR